MTALIAGISGLELTQTDRQIVMHPLVRGVILFKRNYHDYHQLRRLITAIRAIRGKSFLITVDQEGGRVRRFGLPFSQLPALGDLGAVWGDNPDLARALAHTHAWLMAAELLSVGVDMSFAPVLDIDNGSEVIGDRAFSSDPKVVAELGEIYCAGMHAAGMKTTGKHFPGHGTVQADSHHRLPVDTRTPEDIQQNDMVPFARLIAEQKLDAVMLSHVVYARACEQPAGFSAYWSKKILQSALGFSGAIISDDLEMEAATCVGGILARYNACSEAGAHVALTCTPELTCELLASLPRKSPKAPVVQVCHRLLGRSMLDVCQPFWQQKQWVEMRRNLVELQAQASATLK